MPDRLCPLKQATLDAPRSFAIANYTFQELDQLTDLYVKQLQQAGIEPGDRIALYHPVDPRLIAFFFAAWRIGATLCPLNLRLPPEQIAKQLSRLSPALYLTSLASPFPDRKESSKSAEIDLLLFTSGSTGMPKIAALSLKSLLANAAPAVEVLNLKPGDRWLLSLPLFHVAGIGILLRCVLARATLVLDERDPSITHLSYVPTHLYRATPVYKNLTCLMLGGAPISSYPAHLPVYPCYSMTEMGSLIATSLRPPFIEGHCYFGHPLPGREMRLSLEGEIWVRGETLFLGYWEAGQLTLPLNREGWFATGDLGCVSPQAGIAMVGRKDWQFISGGENIQPEEIERELLQLPGVEEAIVIPLPDRKFGARPAAVVRTVDSTFDLKQMERALESKLPKYKIPVSLFQVEQLPKNGFKVDRKQLIKIFTSPNLRFGFSLQENQ